MTLELKIPPVAVVLITAAGMWLAARAVPGFEVPFPGHMVVSGLVAASGGIIALLGVVAFSRVGTTVNPMNPDLRRHWFNQASTPSRATRCIWGYCWCCSPGRCIWPMC